jgi:hypothetical protein
LVALRHQIAKGPAGTRRIKNYEMSKALTRPDLITSSLLAVLLPLPSPLLRSDNCKWELN